MIGGRVHVDYYSSVTSVPANQVSWPLAAVKAENFSILKESKIIYIYIYKQE